MIPIQMIKKKKRSDRGRYLRHGFRGIKADRGRILVNAAVSHVPYADGLQQGNRQEVGTDQIYRYDDSQHVNGQKKERDSATNYKIAI